jgi:predicted ATPase
LNVNHLLRAKAKSKLNDFINSLKAFVEHEIINNGKEKDFIEEYKEAFDKTNFNKIAQAKTERLIIREFGPIHDIDIEIKPVTVIIGSTGSGKSTIIKLLHIFRQLFLESDLTTEKFKEAVSDKFKLVEPIKESYIKYVLGDFFIEYTEGLLNTNFPNDFYDEWNTLKDLSEKPLKSKGKFPLLKTWFEEAALKIQRPLYIPVERTFATSYTPNSAAYQRSKIQIADFILQFIANKQLANSSVKKLDLPFLKATYFFRNNNDIIEHYGSAKLAVGLEYASSGFQAIVPLLLVFEYFSKVKDPFSHFFAVEEPELNLFPTVQKQLVEQMISKTVHSNCRLIMATHSPYILTALNNLIAAKTVTKEQPQSTEVVNKIVPPQYHLDFQDVMAYYIVDGVAKNIMNEEYSMIDANALDDVSNELGHTFDNLLNLRYPN